jgi:8-oxo-dGTP pyrophosphatase MutT (NUDIX family)
VPSANVIVVNNQGEILLIRRTDNGNWAVPGGGIDPASQSPTRPCGKPSKRPAEPQWVSAATVPRLQMHPSMRLRIQHYLDRRTEPYLG